MDGLHLEATRRFERESKQLACASAHFLAGIAAAGKPHGFREFSVIKRSPFAQLIEHTVGHVAGGRPGEGDAQNARRIDAVEQETDDTLSQNVRLAGSGIGRHPGGDDGVGRLALTHENGFGDDALRAHSPPSSTPPVSDHSFTRAR